MKNENQSVKNDISLDENLEDSKKYKLNCNKEKELFLNIIITVIFGFVGFSFVYYFQQYKKYLCNFQHQLLWLNF